MFTERKITQFQHPVADLADTPAQSAAELNGVCDDGAALEERINAYCAQTFAGEIAESMLDTPLAANINAKASQTDMETLQAAVAQKCGLSYGSYTGNGAES